MLATRHRQPFDDPAWAFELKVDGIRALWRWDGEEVDIRSRTGRRIDASYPELTTFQPEQPCVLDGEIIAFDEAGRPSFDLLQHRMSPGARNAPIPVAMMAFDILYLGGDLTRLPLVERRAVLESIELPSPFVLADQVVGEGRALFSAVVDRDLEGIVAKRLDSIYEPGRRSDRWLKIVNRRSMRAVVGGYSPGTGWREQTFGSLALGLWSGDRLRYIGNVGSGFTDADVRAIAEALNQMELDEDPFHPTATMPAGTVYVTPSLVAHVEYATWTDDGHLRAPVFKGFGAEDHREVTWVTEGPDV